MANLRVVDSKVLALNLLFGAECSSTESSNFDEVPNILFLYSSKI